MTHEAEYEDTNFTSPTKPSRVKEHSPDVLPVAQPVPPLCTSDHYVSRQPAVPG